jgi:hypothetical protein
MTELSRTLKDESFSEYQEACENYINETSPEEPKKGFIYAIKSPNTDKIYIGSTFKDINLRLTQHRTAGTTMSSVVISAGEPFIELLEEVMVMNRLELCKHEGRHIKENIDICVNKNIAGLSLKESQKIYQQKHAEWYKEYRREWQKNNKDKVKQYRIKHKLMKEYEKNQFKNII